MKKQINVTIEEKLLKEIDLAAEELGMSRSAFISMSAKTYVNQSTALQNLPRILTDAEKLVALDNVSK